MGSWVPGPRSARDVRRIVADGYDAIGGRFDRWADAAAGSPRERFVAGLAARIPRGARVLEIGCGSASRTTPDLAERFELTGIDVSRRQIDRARTRVPGATFLVADALDAPFAPATFRGVVAMYVMNHVPVAALPAFYARVARWLTPGGSFGANLPVGGAGDGVEASWLGVPMFFASVGADENLRLLGGAGLEVVSAEVVTEAEAVEAGSSSDVAWQWVVARSPEG